MGAYQIQLYTPRTLSLLESAGVPRSRLIERVGLDEAQNLDEIVGTLSKGLSAAWHGAKNIKHGWSGALAAAGEAWRQKAAAQDDARRRAVDAVRGEFERSKALADIKHGSQQRAADILHRALVDRARARAMDVETAARMRAAQPSTGARLGGALKNVASKTAGALKSVGAWMGKSFAPPPPRTNAQPAALPKPAAKATVPAPTASAPAKTIAIPTFAKALPASPRSAAALSGRQPQPRGSTGQTTLRQVFARRMSNAERAKQKAMEAAGTS